MHDALTGMANKHRQKVVPHHIWKHYAKYAGYVVWSYENGGEKEKEKVKEEEEESLLLEKKNKK